MQQKGCNLLPGWHFLVFFRMNPDHYFEADIVQLAGCVKKDGPPNFWVAKSKFTCTRFRS